MSLEGKAAIVTGGDSGIGHAISLELGRQGASVTVNYHKDEASAKATVDAITAAGGKAQAVQGDVSSVADLQNLVDSTVKAFGRARRHGQQRRDGNPDLGPRHDRAAVRPRHRDRPEERVLRGPARGQADDQPGRRRPDHQHLVDPRGLADAGQRALLRGQGRRPDADPDRRRRAGAARDHRRRRGAGSRPHADRRGHPGRSGRAGEARGRDPARARRGACRDREPRRLPRIRCAPHTAPRRPTSSTAG